ncbi:MAG: methyltransferase [Ferruginibacter sp.]|nr:methyltransferase [Ferruginibacter sp.]
MPNDYFQFKHFTIQQENCAMKVCTDACIFGAFVATRMKNRLPVVESILDIGTGTGLLSLMLAQQTNGRIDAVELDGAACKQAKRNFEQSAWRDRLKIVSSNVLEFYPGKKYDFIISNPPFFEGDLKSGNSKKNAAKHDSTLTLEQLLSTINKNLSGDGYFAVLLPYHRTEYFKKIAGEANYFLNEQLLVQHAARHPFFRSVLLFSHYESTPLNNELIIKNEDGGYTPEFTSLLKNYYLHL